jgi:soluble lytic murein transglycosylase
MISTLLVAILVVTSSLAAMTTKAQKPGVSFASQYKKALKDLPSTSACQTLERLRRPETFSLKEVVQLRHAEHCQKKVDWPKLIKTVKREELLPFYYRAQYNYEIKKKHFGNAYRVYNKHRQWIELNKKDFDEMAVKALKTQLTSKEKKALRAELYKKSPRFIPNPSKSQFRNVARDFRNVRNFKKALSYYRRVINDTKQSYTERWRAFRGARRTYKLERWSQMKNYIKASEQWANFLRSKYKWSAAMTKMHHDANIAYIRTLWTEKGQKQAQAPLKRLEKEMSGRYSLQLVYWLKGRMAEERKQYNEAVRWLAKASQEKAITLGDRDRVLWSLAWNQRRIKDYAASEQALEKLKKSKELTFFAKTKYLYWQAENLYSQGKTEKAAAAMQRLADLDNYGYYGALAYRRLGIPFPEFPKLKPTHDDWKDFLKAQDITFLKDLILSQDFEISESFVLERVKTQKSWSAERWVSYLKLLQQAGAYRSFFIRFHQLPPKKQLVVMEQYPHLLFPQPYKDEVDLSAQREKVSSALIYSIMKQESGFDVRARSHADAFGLLQLIPQVARKAAQRRPSIPYNEPYDLYKPHVIIPLGANNLHELFKRFNSSFILSVASYNASEQAVRGWVKSRFQGDPITFIEDIPYEETKGYVKLVMRNYITYNRFQQMGEPYRFPEVCLQGLNEFSQL